jgi:amidase
MTIKDAFETEGLVTTAGAPELADHVPDRDADAVARLRGAGAVIFGKTNLPLYAGDLETFNDVYGRTSNPWDRTRGVGGSSGGAAAALAAGQTAFELGSDIGGSIRNPAHYCGVFGHKPTWGIVSPQGHTVGGRVAMTDISVVGPLARGADDLAVALDVMAGADGIDGAGWQLRLPPPRRKHLREYRVAVMLSDPCSEVDAAVQDRLQALVDFLAKRRVKVSDRARPDIDTREAHRVYIQLLRSATSGRMAAAEFERNLETARTLAPGDESYFAQMTRANVLHHRDWLAANEARHRMRRKWAEFFEEWDLLLCPVTASAAFPHDHEGERHQRTIEVNGRRVPTTDQLFWAGLTCMVYLPATVAPVGLTPGGLPVGVQIAGPQYGDRTCIAFARLLEREYQGFVPPPGYR